MSHLRVRMSRRYTHPRRRGERGSFHRSRLAITPAGFLGCPENNCGEMLAGQSLPRLVRSASNLPCGPSARFSCPLRGPFSLLLRLRTKRPGSLANFDAFAVLLRLDQLAQLALKFVVVFGCLERLRQRFDELLGQLYFLRLQLHSFKDPELRQLANLICKIHGMKQEAVFISTQKHGVIPLVHEQLADADCPGIFQGFDEQLVSLFPRYRPQYRNRMNQRRWGLFR